MKKSLIATAVAAAIAAPAANAGVVVYGKVHGSIDYLNYDYSGDGNSYDYLDSKAWYVSSRASRLGFKGTEDLGNGLSLIWKYETGVNVSDSPESGGIFQGARNAYIGLAGDWGTFLYGRHDTPMKMSTGRLDLFSDQIGDYNYSTNPNNSLLGPGFHDVRADNAIAYISPNWNGFTVAGAIVPGENSNASGSDDATNNGLADSYSVAAMYSNNGLYLAAAYENLMSHTYDDDKGSVASFSPAYTGWPTWCCVENDDPMKVWRIGAGYTMNAFTLNFVYENHDIGDLDIGGTYGTSYTADLWQISGAYDFGNNRIKVAYGENKSDIDGSNASGYLFESLNGKSKHFAIGLDHKLSKRTTAYAAYAQADSDSSLDYGNNEGFSDGGKITGFSMGMMHTF